MPKVTVIIPTTPWTKDYLKVAVESLRATTDWDIIVVSNGGNYYPLDDIKGITLRLHTKQQGQCHAVNIGAHQANPTTDYLFISNDDMYYAPNWKKNLRFESPVFSPNLAEPVNNAGSAPPFVKVNGGYTLEEFDKAIVDEFIADSVASGEAAPQDGFNFPLFIDSRVWRTIGGYDETYDPWGSNSDTDLQAKVHLYGIQTKRYFDVLVYHFSNKSGTFDGTHQDAWQRNWDYFTNKWGFNRDMIPTDVWYSKNILPDDQKMIKYKPDWAGEYAKA